MPTLSVAMICKDESDNLKRCIPSFLKYCSELIVVDTGSTDDTRSVAVSFGASCYDFNPKTHPDAFFMDDEKTCQAFGYSIPGTYSNEIAFGDFGAARNESFKHATGDFILWVDADDVVEGAEHLPEIVADLAARSMDFGFLAYDYARDDKGRVFYRQWRERIIRRGLASWVNPVHEVLMPSRPVVPVRYEQTWLSHHRKADRKSLTNRNYKLLLRHLKREHEQGRVDPRTMFYLGQEARFIEPQRAVGFYNEYLKTSGWPEERAAAHVSLGHLYEFGQVGLPADESYARAEMHYATAAEEKADNPDGVFGLARVAYMRKRFDDCVRYSDKGFAIGNTDSMLGANPVDRTYRPHVYYNHSLANLGRLEDAIKSCKAALEVFPDDPGVPGGASGMLAYNLKIYEAEMEKRQAPQLIEGRKPLVVFDKNEDVDTPQPDEIPHDAFVIYAMQLWKLACKLGDGTRARSLLDGLPAPVASDPVVAKMRASTERRWPFMNLTASPVEATPSPEPRATTGGALSIVFWIGPAFEPWDPTTPNTKGIGGSETACVEMARELRRLGHKVTVYGDCEKTAGIYDGVEYRHYQKAVQHIVCDVFISSRVPQIMDAHEQIRAKIKLLWVHDINVGAPSPQMERWLMRFDRILCLSEFHKQHFVSCYPTLHPDRVIVTRNGIDPERFSIKNAGEAVRDSLHGNFEPARFGDNESNVLNAIKRNTLIFSSSPNRGLMAMLELFPHIRARVPDAELHAYYGLDVWLTFAKQRGDANELATIANYQRLIAEAEKSGGFFYHGRVNQKELAQAFMRAKVWSYSTIGPELFPETSCVSAMEAQAAGCVPVTTAYGALNETVKHGILIQPTDPDGAHKFVDECVRLLTDEAYRAPLAKAGREYGMSLSWSSLAKDWTQMFVRIAGEVEQAPVAMWRSA